MPSWCLLEGEVLERIWCLVWSTWDLSRMTLERETSGQKGPPSAVASLHSHQIPDNAATWSWTVNFQNCEPKSRFFLHQSSLSGGFDSVTQLRMRYVTNDHKLSTQGMLDILHRPLPVASALFHSAPCARGQTYTDPCREVWLQQATAAGWRWRTEGTGIYVRSSFPARRRETNCLTFPRTPVKFPSLSSFSWIPETSFPFFPLHSLLFFFLSPPLHFPLLPSSNRGKNDN